MVKLGQQVSPSVSGGAGKLGQQVGAKPTTRTRTRQTLSPEQKEQLRQLRTQEEYLSQKVRETESRIKTIDEQLKTTTAQGTREGLMEERNELNAQLRQVYRPALNKVKQNYLLNLGQIEASARRAAELKSYQEEQEEEYWNAQQIDQQAPGSYVVDGQGMSISREELEEGLREGDIKAGGTYRSLDDDYYRISVQPREQVKTKTEPKTFEEHLGIQPDNTMQKVFGLEEPFYYAQQTGTFSPKDTGLEIPEYEYYRTDPTKGTTRKVTGEEYQWIKTQPGVLTKEFGTQPAPSKFPEFSRDVAGKFSWAKEPFEGLGKAEEFGVGLIQKLPIKKPAKEFTTEAFKGFFPGTKGEVVISTATFGAGGAIGGAYGRLAAGSKLSKVSKGAGFGLGLLYTGITTGQFITAGGAGERGRIVGEVGRDITFLGAGYRMASGKSLLNPTTKIYEPKRKPKDTFVVEKQKTVITGGKQVTFGEYNIYGELRPPTRVKETTRFRQLFKLKPKKEYDLPSRPFLQTTLGEVKVGKPFTVFEKRGATGGTIRTMELTPGGETVYTGKLPSQLGKMEKFGFRRLAEFKTGVLQPKGVKGYKTISKDIRASPRDYAKALWEEGKIYAGTYEPGGFEGAEGVFIPKYKKGKPAIAISSDLYGIEKQKTIAHELIHYKTPKWVFKTPFEYLPYKYKPSELLAFKLETRFAKRGFKAKEIFRKPVGQERDISTLFEPESIKQFSTIGTEQLSTIGGGRIKPTRQLGKRTSLDLSFTEARFLRKGEFEDIYLTDTVFKDVSKPFAKATGRTPGMRGFLKVKREPEIWDDTLDLRDFITPADIKKTPFSSTFQAQIQQPIQLPKPASPRPTLTKTKTVSTGVSGLTTTSAFAGTGLYERTAGGLYPGETTVSFQPSTIREKPLFKTAAQPRTETKTVLTPLQRPLTKSITKTISRPMLKPLTRVVPKQTTKQISKPITKPVMKFPIKTPPPTQRRIRSPFPSPRPTGFRFPTPSRTPTRITQTRKQPSSIFARTRREPSLVALGENIFAPSRARGERSGLVIRPIIEDKKKKKGGSIFSRTTKF